MEGKKRGMLAMKKYLAFGILGVAVLLFLSQTVRAFDVVNFHADFFQKKGKIILDAGHGGEDGGAVGINGVNEKDINLAIALHLQKYLLQQNFEVIMVRDADYAVGDQSLGTVAKRKSSDTKNRVRTVEEAGDCILISIHQNHFTQSKYAGAQIFYSGNREESGALAEAIRKSIVSSLQPENKRENKKAEKNIYLLDHVEVPAVLVECGFLSNGAEADLLNQPQYQEDMAKAIYNGLISYLEESTAEEGNESSSEK